MKDELLTISVSQGICPHPTRRYKRGAYFDEAVKQYNVCIINQFIVTWIAQCSPQASSMSAEIEKEVLTSTQAE